MGDPCLCSGPCLCSASLVSAQLLCHALLPPCSADPCPATMSRINLSSFTAVPGVFPSDGEAINTRVFLCAWTGAHIQTLCECNKNLATDTAPTLLNCETGSQAVAQAGLQLLIRLLSGWSDSGFIILSTVFKHFPVPVNSATTSCYFLLSGGANIRKHTCSSALVSLG